MRYIGGKRLLTEQIVSTISGYCGDVKSVIDVFAGSGVVSNAFKKAGYKVYSNGCLYFSYAINKGILSNNTEPKFPLLGIEHPIDYLNNLTLEKTEIDIEKCFIYQNYSPNKNCERMYFQSKNAIKIDIIRITIEEWYQQGRIAENEYYYLLASLIQAVPFVANIAGVYAAYLKHWDVRTYKDLTLEKPELISSRKKSLSFNMDCDALLNSVHADVLYADPPYNARQYLPNYHILETIARYDYPIIHGKTGMREYKKEKSNFCQKARVKDAFERMIQKANTKYVVISYSSEGLLSTEELSTLCKKYAAKDTFKLIETDYRRYKSKIPNSQKKLKEQIYLFQKKTESGREIAGNHFIKSPMNYVGGKYKLLPQMLPLFPDRIDIFLDLFAGGGDVFSNVQAKETIANDNNYHLIEIFKYFQKNDIDGILKYIDRVIKKYKLSITNKDGYDALKKEYNKTRKPIDLFILSCYSFNHQLRFNSKHEFNCPFGKDRSYFNATIRNNLIAFHKAIQGVELIADDFREIDLSFLKKDDFVYADPPYLITTGPYNDGKRGFDGWTEDHDKALYSLLDELNKRGVHFALSNVIEHKGIINEALCEWSKKYNVHHMDFNYNNANYHANNKENATIEVLITNY